MILKELLESTLRENVEDRHSEVYGEFEDKLAHITDPVVVKKLKREMKQAMAKFSRGYESDYDDLMYDGLDDMRNIVARM